MVWKNCATEGIETEAQFHALRGMGASMRKVLDRPANGSPKLLGLVGCARCANC